MDRQQVKELLPIIQAYAEGKQIEIKTKEGKSWSTLEEDDIQYLDFKKCDFRIKPEPKYRPFKDAKECWQEMQKHQPFGWILDRYGEIYNIAKVRASSITICLAVGFEFYNYEEASEFTFTDGTPFGILEDF